MYSWEKKLKKNTLQKSHQITRYLGCPPCKILGTILNVDEKNFNKWAREQEISWQCIRRYILEMTSKGCAKKTTTASIQDNVNASTRLLENYIKNRGGRLITASRNNTDNASINRRKITRKQKWEEKQSFRKGNLKRETESLLIVVQNNAIRTNYVKARIDKTQENSRCRLCGDRDEMNNHIISEYSKLARRKYKTRNDLVGEVYPYGFQMEGCCTKCTVVTLHDTNGRLQCHSVQMEVRAGAVPIDIWITLTTTQSHLFHHVANGFMHVMHRLKY